MDVIELGNVTAGGVLRIWDRRKVPPNASYVLSRKNRRYLARKPVLGGKRARRRVIVGFVFMPEDGS